MKNKNRTFPVLWLFGLLLCLSACHSNFHLTSTPHIDKDFYQPADDLSLNFFDLERFKERTFPFFTFHEMPPLTELKYGKRFGEALSTEMSWWNACPLFLVPPLCPCKIKVWERGNYRFTVKVLYPAIFGYKGHIWFWDVVEVFPGRLAPKELPFEPSEVEETAPSEEEGTVEPEPVEETIPEETEPPSEEDPVEEPVEEPADPGRLTRVDFV